MLRLKQLVFTLLLSSLTLACGQGSLQRGGFLGLGSLCYLDAYESHGAFVSFDGHVGLDSVADLRFSSCEDVTGDAVPTAVQVDDPSVLSAEIVTRMTESIDPEANESMSVETQVVRVTAHSVGTAVITISRANADEVSFEIFVKEPNTVQFVDAINNKSIVLGASFSTFVKMRANNTALLGAKNWSEAISASAGLEVTADDTNGVTITAQELGAQSVELAGMSNAISVIELSSVQMSLNRFLSGPEAAVYLLDLHDQDGQKVLAAGEAFMPSYTFEEGSACTLLSMSDAQNVWIASNGAESCMLTVTFGEQVINEEVTFPAESMNNPDEM